MRRWRLFAVVLLAAVAAPVGVVLAGRPPDERGLPDYASRLVAAGAPVYCGGGDGQDLVALTFDDGPGVYTRQLLDIVDAAGAGVTFFDLGRMIGPGRRMLRRELIGHSVGVHSWTHPDLRALSPARVMAEIEETQAVIALYGGGEPVWLFRPPYGAHNQTVDSAVAQLRMLTVLWSVNSNDTGLSDPNAIATNVEAGVRPGSIVLLHENNNRGPTIAAMPRILELLRERGLRPVTVDELLRLDPPSARQLRTGPYGCGPTLWSVSPSTGNSAGGTAVTLSGDQLKLARDVMFGHQRAQIIDAGDGSSLRVIAPPGTGTVDITLTTHFGASPTSPLDRFSYNPNS